MLSATWTTLLLLPFLQLSLQRVVNTNGKTTTGEQYYWREGQWSECSGHCNTGYQQRTVACVHKGSRTEEVVRSSFCTEQRPAQEKTCNLTACESWYVGDWEECQCPGYSVRPVVCYMQDEIDGLYRVAAPSSCPSPRPDNLRPCTPSANNICPDGVDDVELEQRRRTTSTASTGEAAASQRWLTGPWSQCNSMCGLGNQTRLVWCSQFSSASSFSTSSSSSATGTSDGPNVQQLPDAMCNGSEKPESLKSCDSGPCKQANWIVSRWSGCPGEMTADAVCGNDVTVAVETRLVLCVTSDGQLYNASTCSESTPEATRLCRRHVTSSSSSTAAAAAACDVRPAWYTSQWSACSATCGRGRRRRRVVCLVRQSGPDRLSQSAASWSQLDEGQCPHGGGGGSDRRPEEEEDCEAPTDCQLVWMMSPVEKCPTGGCGSNQSVYCYSDGQLVDRSACDPKTRPTDTELMCSGSQQGCQQAQTGGVSGGGGSVTTSTSAAAANCRLSSYGCCPDGSTAASGPDNVGCVQLDAVPQGLCFLSEFGCCPDGLTVALGPNGDGCLDSDCQLTEFGCCADGYTAASGPNGHGCPLDGSCFLTLYGCCPDGLTPANGPKGTGCEHLVTSTPATSPLTLPCGVNEVCGPGQDSGLDSSGEVPPSLCADSPHGCCPDGRTARKSDTDRCEIPATDVTSRSAVVTDNGQLITSGGAGDDVSVEVSSVVEEQFLLPTPGFINTSSGAATGREGLASPDRADVSSKSTFVESWTTGAVDTVKDAANEDSLTAPGNESASVTQSPVSAAGDRCSLPADRGNCQLEISRWYFDSAAARCVNFTYTGCGGNDNRFESETSCTATCIDSSIRGLAVCDLAPDPGPCSVHVMKWHYNRDLGRCLQFAFGGCHGNANKFDTRQDCEGVCPAVEICKLPADTGRCSDAMMRFHYSSATDECEAFTYGGCRGNANRFLTRADCERTCRTQRVAGSATDTGQETADDLCLLPGDSGPCDSYREAFYYNATTSQCQPFAWGGCGGNGNRFVTRADCEQRCLKNTIARRPLPGRQDGICLLKNEPGPCEFYQPMWYFEPVTGVCRRFLYGGCAGNDNRFETAEDCWVRCGGSQDQPSTFSPLLLPGATTLASQQQSPTGNHTRRDPKPECLLPADMGPCIAHQLRWYHDLATGTCRQFTYGGCQGNANNYNTSADCERACLQQVLDVTSAKPNDVCDLPKDSGPCFSDDLRYYWDPTISQCRPFIYGGCHGNANNFQSQDDCYSACYSTAERRRSAAAEAAGAALPPRRLYRPGDCYEVVSAGRSCDGDGSSVEAEARWYFDTSHGDCLAFYYSGCDGSGNNLRSYDDCLALCSKVTETCGVFQCDLVCDYGYARGPAGCLKCQCGDPCQDYTCGDGMECYMDSSSCVAEPCAPKPRCRPASKPGECPLLKSAGLMKRAANDEDQLADFDCVVECGRDGDCTGSAKCCDVGCNRTCVEPRYGCANTVFGCCPDGLTAALEWNNRGCPDEAPSFIDNPRQIFAVVGRNVTITCKARGAPQPTITWYRNSFPILVHNEARYNDDGEELADNSVSAVDTGRFSLLSDDTLSVVNVTRADANTYSCRAYNTLGAATRTYTLTVHVPVQIEDVVPGNVTLREGGTTTFKCLTTGEPSALIQWFHDDDEVPLGDDGQHVELDGSKLTLTNVTLKHEGRYVCEATNKVGPTQRVAANLDVVGDFFVDVTTGGAGSNFTRGDNVTLLCNVTGDVTDDVVVTWSKDGQPLADDESRYNATSAELLVSDMAAPDSGEYTCTAKRGPQQAQGSTSIVVHGQRLPEGCLDRPWLANCKLLVEARLCNHAYYRIFCCQSCFEAGQLLT